MSGEQEKKYLQGEVVNTISNIYKVETDSQEFPDIDLVRNSITIELNPLLAEIGLFDRLKMKIVDGPYGRIFQIQEMVKASAKAKYLRTYADAIAKGHVGIPENLSTEVPAPLTLDQYRKTKLEGETDESIPAVLRPNPEQSNVVPISKAVQNNGAGNSGKPRTVNGSNGEIDLHRLPADGKAIVAGD